MKAHQSLLANQKVVNWCYAPVTEDSLINTSNPKLLRVANKIEKEWARSVIGGKGNQWTTELCQELVREALEEMGRSNVRSAKSVKSTLRSKKYQPDLECDDYIYEVKGRSWTTPGTAGEKILGVPLKYGEVPQVYRKPLRIVLVGYQEYEARNGYGFGDLLNSEIQTKQLKGSLEHYKNQKIEYLGFTELLKKLGLKQS